MRFRSNLKQIIISLAFASHVSGEEFSFFSSVRDQTNDPLTSWSRIAITTSNVSKNGAVKDSTTKFITDTDIGTAWKPNPSLDGEKIVFFRSPDDSDWETPNIISVVDMSGENLKDLSVGNYPDWNPNWMRDGSNRIVFYRKNYLNFFISIWLTSSDWEQGKEVMLSSSKWLDDLAAQETPRVGYEWAWDSFDDSSILVIRNHHIPDDNSSTQSQPCRMVFDSCNNYASTCTDITLDGIEWNADVGYLFLSSSQKYVTYLKNGYYPGLGPLIGDLCYAEIDINNNIIRNEDCFFINKGYTMWYGKFDQSEKNIIFAFGDYSEINSEVYFYDISTKTTGNLTSSDDLWSHRYPSPLNYNVKTKKTSKSKKLGKSGKIPKATKNSK